MMMPVFFRTPFSVNLVVTVPILNFFVSIIVMELKYKIKTIKGSVSLGGWKSGRIEKWKNRKDFSFSYLCLVGRVEKLRDGKLFCLVENKVCINLPSCPV